jgi:hypothetical protein
MESMRDIDDESFQSFLMLVQEIARIRPHKRRRWKAIYQDHRDLWNRVRNNDYFDCIIDGLDEVLWLDATCAKYRKSGPQSPEPIAEHEEFLLMVSEQYPELSAESTDPQLIIDEIKRMMANDFYDSREFF